MPLGFANNIFTASSTTAGADWSAWDGSSDVTQDTVSFSGNVEHFLSFEWFDETYGLVVYSKDPGAGFDQIKVRLVTNTNDTLTYGLEVDHSVTNYTGFTRNDGFVGRTANGEIIVKINDNTGKFRTYWMSGSSLQQSDLVTTTMPAGGTGLIRNTDGDFIIQNRVRTIYKVTFSNIATSTPSDSITELEFGTSSTMIQLTEQVNGFFDKNTVIGFYDYGGSGLKPSGKANKMDVTGGDGDPTVSFSGLSEITFDLVAGSTASIGWEQPHPPFETTDFTNKSLFWELSNTPSGTQRITKYVSGATSYAQANITDADIPNGDTSVNGIYVGSNDTVFLYMMMDIGTNSLIFIRYNTSTNTIDQPLIVDNGASFTSEEARLCRWGNDRAMLMYNGDKIRLLVP